jgi:hypothetical protein
VRRRLVLCSALKESAIDPLREQLKRELAAVQRRPVLEERLARAMAERRGALSNLGRIERELGPRLFEMEEAKQRRARMHPRLYAFCDALGLLPFPDPEAPRVEQAERELEAREQAVALVHNELGAFRDVDSRIDALVALWNAEQPSALPTAPPLARLGEELSRLRARLDELERAYECLTVAGWAAGSASLLLTEAAEVARSELHSEAQPWGRAEARVLRRAEADLAVAASEIANARVMTDAASSDASLSQAALCTAREVAWSPPLAEVHATRVVPVEGAGMLSGAVVVAAKSSLEDVGREITKTRAEIETLTAEREERIRQLLQAVP